MDRNALHVEVYRALANLWPPERHVLHSNEVQAWLAEHGVTATQEELYNVFKAMHDDDEIRGSFAIDGPVVHISWVHPDLMRFGSM